VLGCHDDRFTLKKSSADRKLLVPPATHPRFTDALQRLIETERVDLVIPNTDRDVRMISDLRDTLPCRVFLPDKAAIDVCHDKYELTMLLRSRAVPAPLTYPVTDLDALEEIFGRFAPASRLWCRIRGGSGSMGALPVKTPAQARAWIEYWQEMRGIPAGAFTVSEYLPGRDFACASLWKDGALVLIKTVERLAYFGGVSRASGVSSTAALAKTVIEPDVVEVCVHAIRALGHSPSGAFSVDVKADARGVPCVTEINVGRFITMMNIFDLTGKHNMAAAYVKLALGEAADVAEPYDVSPDCYFVRDVDTVPGIFHAEELFEGIEDGYV
jgi:carbamoyl-phosphate synthase large subunit